MSSSPDVSEWEQAKLTNVGDDVKIGSPQLELPLPIDYGGERDADQKRALAVALLVERVEKGDGLDGLAQAHLVGEDGVGAVAPRVAQPVESLQLVRVQLQPALANVVGLLVVLFAQVRRGFVRRGCVTATACTFTFYKEVSNF